MKFIRRTKISNFYSLVRATQQPFARQFTETTARPGSLDERPCPGNKFAYIWRMDKQKFFAAEYLPLIKKLKGSEKPQWGKLSAQGMVEHMTDSIGIAWGRVKEPMVTPAEHLEKAKSFAMSDKEFRPDTRNTLMSETPAPLRHTSMEDATHELENEVFLFLSYYDFNPEAVVTNPFYGDLNYKEWLHLLHKHATHHLKQFAVIS